MTEPTSTSQQLSSLKTSNLRIRSARQSDSAAVSRICLLTADAGVSAEASHSIGELPGLVYAVPYLHTNASSGFVLVREGGECVDEQLQGEDGSEVVAYLVFASDTTTFTSLVETRWYPPLRSKYPKFLIEVNAEGDYQIAVSSPQLTAMDKHYIKLLHNPDPTPEACLAFSPAHMHINILPPYQRQGWGRRLIGQVVEYLRDEKGLSGVWLGMDPRNDKAARFYERVGFQHVEGAPGNCVGLKFEDWNMIADLVVEPSHKVGINV